MVLLAVFLGLVLAADFVFAGKSAASYVANHVEPVNFFRDGKFLIVFQNNSELRSSGGFIGSFAVLEMKNFEIKNLNFNTNIYKLDNAYAKSHYEEAPGALADYLKGHSWTLRDSNYDASFSEAAVDITHFYEAETKDKIDGVVAINASLMVDLLKITGPIVLPKYGTTIDATNFFYQTQYQIEKAYFQNSENANINEPKTIIKDLYPEIISRALTKNKSKLLGVFEDELRSKNVQFYFKDQSKENIVLKNNWGGAVFQDKNTNYLYVVANNYSGNKSSLSLAQSLEYSLSANQADLTISRIHHGTNQWPDGINESYLRILVPENSVVSSATLNGQNVLAELDVIAEAGKNSFGMLVRVAPAQAAVLKISFELPKNIDTTKLTVQKQPGTIGDEIKFIRDGHTVYAGLLQSDMTLE